MPVKTRCPNTSCAQINAVDPSQAKSRVKCPKCGTTYVAQSTMIGDGAPSTPDGVPLATPVQTTTGVGRFVVKEKLGAGAFGTVYRAYDPHLDREVALKIPNAAVLANPKHVERFLREARAAARLRHPNIVPVYDAGADGGRPYIATAFIKGRPLSDAVEAGGLAYDRAARIARELADALAYAHEQKIVHRDVKPHNVMLDETDHVHLMDFGLAFFQDEAAKLTNDGALLGTPAYMAPEQAAGRSGDATPAMDQYAVGVVLYELLSGQVPFEGLPAAIIARVQTEEVPPLRSIRPRISKDLETICRKAMAKHPAERYSGCRGLADDLRRWLDGEDIRARPMGRVVRSAKWVRRNPVVTGLLAAVLLLLIGGTTGIYIKYKDADKQKKNALFQERDANEQRAEAVRQARIAELNARLALEIKTGAETKDTQAIRLEQIAKERLEKANAAVDDKEIALKDLNYNLALSRILSAQTASESNNPTFVDQQLEQVPLSLRNWEWAYIKRHSVGAVHILRGHKKPVNSVAISPNGSRLVTGSSDGTFKVWDLETGTLMHDSKLIGGDVTCVAFSPDSSRILTGTDYGPVKLWDASDGHSEIILEGHTQKVLRGAFSRDGTIIITTSQDGLVKVWDAKTGRCVRDYSGHTGAVRCVALSKVGTWAVTGGDDKTARVWDWQTGRTIGLLRGHTGDVRSVAFNLHGNQVVTGSEDKSIKVWKWEDSTLLRDLKGQLDGVSGVAYSLEGHRIVTGSYDGTVKIWVNKCDILSPFGPKAPPPLPNRTLPEESSEDTLIRSRDEKIITSLLTLKGHTSSVLAAAFSPDGTKVVTGSQDSTAIVWRVNAGTPPIELRVYRQQDYDRGIRSDCFVVFCLDNSRILTVSGGVVRVWDAKTGSLLLDLKKQQYVVDAAALSPDGTRIVAGGQEWAKVWDVKTGNPLFDLRGSVGEVTSFAFNPDGTRIATANSNKSAKIFDATTGLPLRELKGHGDGITSIAFGPDGTHVVTGSNDKTVKLWDVISGRTLLTLQGHEHTVTSVAYSKDGTRILTSSHDKSAKVWDAISGKPLLTLRGHGDGVTSAAFSPDGTRIVTSSRDKTAKVWDGKSGTPLLDLKAHLDSVTSAAFSQDGNRIITGSRDGTAKIWGE